MTILGVELSQKRQQCPNCKLFELVNTGNSSRFVELDERWWCKNCGTSVYVTLGHFGDSKPGDKEAPLVKDRTITSYSKRTPA